MKLEESLRCKACNLWVEFKCGFGWLVKLLLYETGSCFTCGGGGRPTILWSWGVTDRTQRIRTKRTISKMFLCLSDWLQLWSVKKKTRTLLLSSKEIINSRCVRLQSGAGIQERWPTSRIGLFSRKQDVHTSRSYANEQEFTRIFPWPHRGLYGPNPKHDSEAGRRSDRSSRFHNNLCCKKTHDAEASTYVIPKFKVPRERKTFS